MNLWRYVAARMGRKAYLKGLFMRPVVKVKEAFRRKAGPSKKQLAGWLEGEKERAACDKRLADSLEELLLSNLE